MSAAVSTNRFELEARWKKVKAVLDHLGDDVRGEVGAAILERLDDDAWRWLAENARVHECSRYTRRLIVESIRRRGGG